MKVVFKICILAFLFSVHGHGQRHVPNNDIAAIDSLNKGYYRTINNNPTISLGYAQKAFSYFEKIQDERLKFRLAINYATALFINGDYEKAHLIINKAKGIAVGKKGKALYFTMLGLIENDLNHFTEAESAYKKALGLYTILEDKNNQFTVLNNLGILYNNIGAYNKALETYLKCYGLIDSLAADVDRYKYYMNRGTASYNLQDYTNALNSYRTALKTAVKNRDSLRIFRSYEKIAQTNLALGNLDQALYYYKKTLRSYSRIGLKKELIEVLLEIGNIYYAQGKEKTALDYFMRSHDLAHQKDHQVLEAAEASLRLGKFFLDQTEYEKAENYYKEVISIEAQTINPLVLMSAYLGLYKIAQHNNNALLSLKYLKKYHQYDNETRQKQLANERKQIAALFNLKKKELELENLKANYQIREIQLDKKNQKITGLILFAILTSLVFFLILLLYIQKRKAQSQLIIKNKKIDIRNKTLKKINEDVKAQRKELSSLNAFKDQLLSIISHDVKSPLTNLSSLLHILRNNIEGMKKGELKKNLASIESDTVNLLNLLNNILNWTIGQSTGVKVKTTRFSVTELVRKNLALVESSMVAKDLTILFDPGDKAHFIKSDKNIVDLALRNILSNAVKFTGANGTIDIAITQKSNTLAVKIADSGIGVKKEMLGHPQRNNVEAPFALNNGKVESGYGIGLSLCKMMLEKIGSEIVFENNQPSGAVFTLYIGVITK